MAMSAVVGFDLGSVLSTLGNWLVTFLQTLVQYAPYFVGIAVAGYLVYRFSGTIRRALGSLLSLF